MKHEGDPSRIIVVDDEPSVARFVSRLLEIHGYNVQVFNDSRAVATLFRSGHAQGDLLLTDQTMPGMTGVELVQEVREIVPLLPIILFTGFSESISEEEVASWGRSAYLDKPVDSAHLIAVIEDLLTAA